MFCWTVHLTGERKGGCYSAVTVGDKVYYFGGLRDGNTAQIDVSVFNTVSLRWRKVLPVSTGEDRPLEVPPKVSGHTAVLIEDIIYIWGGKKYYRSEWCNVLYAFDVDTHRWFKPRVSGTVPLEREDHSACVLGKVMFIHGGYISLQRRTNDMFKLDTTTMVWSSIDTRGTAPPDSDCHSATIIGTKMFVFGGWLVQGQDYTLRVFDTKTNRWMNTPSAQRFPEIRYDHSAFAYNGELYIFGGGCSNFWNFNDLWKFNPESFSWKKVKPKGKGPPLTYGMCCCMVGDCIIIFGGYKTAKDLFILDLSPSLKMLCKLAVIRHGVEQAGLTHNIRWELATLRTCVTSRPQEGPTKYLPRGASCWKKIKPRFEVKR